MRDISGTARLLRHVGGHQLGGHAPGAERALAGGGGHIFRYVVDFLDQLRPVFVRVAIVQAVDFGQDDEILSGAIAVVSDLVKDSDKIQNIYLDFSQFDEQKKLTVCQSMIDRQLLKPINKEVIYTTGASDYFSVISDSPSFLPATIVKFDKRIMRKLRPFIGTHYVQYAYFTLCLNRGQTIILKKQLVRGPIPEDGWQKNGNSLYNIAIGKLYCQFLLNNNYDKIFPTILLERKKEEFIANYFKLLLLSFFYGLTEINGAKKQLFQIFDSGIQKNYIVLVNAPFQIAILLKKKLLGRNKFV